MTPFLFWRGAAFFISTKTGLSNRSVTQPWVSPSPFSVLQPVGWGLSSSTDDPSTSFSALFLHPYKTPTICGNTTLFMEDIYLLWKNPFQLSWFIWKLMTPLKLFLQSSSTNVGTRDLILLAPWAAFQIPHSIPISTTAAPKAERRFLHLFSTFACPLCLFSCT
jgi:hypothetical protein